MLQSAMMSICFKEGIKISPEALSQLIVSSGQDIRQTVHLLSVCASGLTSDEAKAVRKDIKMVNLRSLIKVIFFSLLNYFILILECSVHTIC